MSATETKEIEYIITPPKGLIYFNLEELLRYKELFLTFVWRDIKVRYKQTALGILWAIIQPLFTMVIFTIFFGRLAKVPSDGVPYPVFVYAGLLLWNYFSTAITNTSNSMIDNINIVKKVYFPRLILPLSTSLTPIVDFVFAFVILLSLMAYYHFMPSFYGLGLLIVLLLICFMTAAGTGLVLSAINAKYRDVRYIVPFLTQILMYLTPVIYPVSIIPEKFQWIIYLNPIAGAITVARSSLLHTGAINYSMMLLSLGSSLLILLLGIGYFRKTERYLDDIL